MLSSEDKIYSHLLAVTGQVLREGSLGEVLPQLFNSKYEISSILRLRAGASFHDVLELYSLLYPMSRGGVQRIQKIKPLLPRIHNGPSIEEA